MDKYNVGFYDITSSCLHTVVIECESESELSALVDKYVEDNLEDLDIAGAKWSKVIK